MNAADMVLSGEGAALHAELRTLIVASWQRAA